MTEADAAAIIIAATGPSPDYPTLDCALACPDCTIIFRDGDCPKCGSGKGLMNLGVILSPLGQQPVAEAESVLGNQGLGPCDGCGRADVPLPATLCGTCEGARL